MLKLVAKKIGMSHNFSDSSGAIIPITFLYIYDVSLLNIESKEKFQTVSLCFDKNVKSSKISNSVIGKFKKKSMPVHRVIKTFNTSFDIKEASSSEDIDPFRYLEIDKLVDVSGKTTGKGFAGVMKRWGFRGLEASHGVSVSHRSHGSTGQRQDPGKVFKGKKMAGHLGCDSRTIKNLSLAFLDKDSRVIGLKGSIPGTKGSDVVVKIK
jgi:large subunit ribosomal protein L3